MKHRLFSTATVLFFVTIIALILAIATGYFYQQTKKYKDLSRALIIQNDSIISVNIELKNAIRFIPVAKRSVHSFYKATNQQ